MINKKLEVFIRIFITFIMTIGFSLSCSKKDLNYEDQFNLKRFKLRHFDLYNPILNAFRLDPIERQEHPNYYCFDVYFDDNDIVRYSFYRSGSYGYLQEFTYDNVMNIKKVSKVRIYPILVNSIDKNASIITNYYYYTNGTLKAFKDELNGNIFIINGDSVFMYKGIISPSESFSVKRINPNEYFKKLLH